MFTSPSPSHHPSWLVIGFLLFTLTGSFSTSLHADPPPTSLTTTAHAALADQTIVWFNQLTADNPQLRDQALTGLLTDTILSDQTLKQLYKQSQDPQQRAYLRQIAIHHTIRRQAQKAYEPNDQGILGMIPTGRRLLNNASSSPSPTATASDGQACVFVRWTFPGMPAYASLRVGDRITAVDNQAIPNAPTSQQITLQFIQMIATHRPGQTITLHVLRDEYELDIPIQLSSSIAMQSVYQPNTAALRHQLSPQAQEKVSNMLASLEAIHPSAKPIVIALPPATEHPQKATPLNAAEEDQED